MRGWLLLVVITASLPCSLQGAISPDTDPQKTLSVYNGRWWNAIHVDVRLGFVYGYNMYHAKSCEKSTFEWFAAAPIDNEIIAGLDRFYAEPADMPIPLPLAWEMVAMKFSGKAAAEFDSQTKFARRLAMGRQ